MADFFDSLIAIFSNMGQSIGEFIPSLFLALVVLGIGWILARIIRTILERVLEQIKFDDVVERTGLMSGLNQAGIKQSSSSIVASLFYWIVFLNFLMQALDELGLQQAVKPLRDFIDFLPQIVVGLITLILGSLLVQFLARTLQGAMAGMGLEFYQALGNIVRIILMGVLIIIVMEQMGLDITLLTDVFTSTITIIIAGAALAFGIGGRSLARNVLAGYYAREMFHLGDTIVIDDEEGVLQGISTLNAEILVGDDVISIPNTRLTEGRVKVRA